MVPPTKIAFHKKFTGSRVLSIFCFASLLHGSRTNIYFQSKGLTGPTKLKNDAASVINTPVSMGAKLLCSRGD